MSEDTHIPLDRLEGLFITHYGGILESARDAVKNYRYAMNLLRLGDAQTAREILVQVNVARAWESHRLDTAAYRADIVQVMRGTYPYPILDRKGSLRDIGLHSLSSGIFKGDQIRDSIGTALAHELNIQDGLSSSSATGLVSDLDDFLTESRLSPEISPSPSADQAWHRAILTVNPTFEPFRNGIIDHHPFVRLPHSEELIGKCNRCSRPCN